MNSSLAPEIHNISAVILAGGQGQRMYKQDKGLLPFADTTLIEYTLKRLQQQVSNIYISANRNQLQYQQLEAKIISDLHPGFPGPLAGMYTALTLIETDWLLTIPCDTPFFPADLLSRFIEALQLQPHLIAVARDEKYLQPVFSLLHRSLISDLHQFLDNGQHKTGQWIRQQQPVEVMFENSETAFLNINSPEQLQQAKPLQGKSAS